MVRGKCCAGVGLTAFGLGVIVTAVAGEGVCIVFLGICGVILGLLMTK